MGQHTENPQHFHSSGKILKGLGTGTNIDEHKRAIEDLHKSIRARDDLMSICGHELKTPLTTLNLLVQLTEKRIARGDVSVYEPVHVQNILSKFGSQIERLARLVDDMLDVTILNSGKLCLNFEEVNLSLLVVDVLDRFSNELQASGCTVSVSAISDVIGTWDKFRLEQVLINLLTNAMRYGQAKPISIVVGRQDNSAYFSVQDQGIGIAKQDQVRVFQRFERAISSSEVRGLGLGLYIVESIVSAHRGSILLESALGEGSKFTVELPIFAGAGE